MHSEIIQSDIEQIAASPSCRWEGLRDSSILITGANGMLATYIIYTLLHLNRTLGLNIEITALARNVEATEANFGEAIESGELKTLYQDVRQLIEYDAPLDYIFHFAGSATPQAITSNPVGVIEANSVGLINALELARKAGAKIIFPSTREVYGAMPQGTTLLSEETMGVIDPIDPRSCYPESKRLGETLCKSYNTQYGLPYLILRIAHSYGAMMQLEGDGRVMADLLCDAVNGRDIVLNSTGEAIRAFCYATDAVEGIFTALLEGGDCGLYNLANEGEPISILDLAKLIVEVSANPNIEVRHREATAQERSGYTSFERVSLETTRLQSLGWRTRVELREGISRVLRYAARR